MAVVLTLVGIVILPAFQHPHGCCTVDAFASYLLSTTGCRTDLDTTEVIMNQLVVAAGEEESANNEVVDGDEAIPSFHVVVADHTVAADGSLTIATPVSSSHHPILLSLQIVPTPPLSPQSTHVKDYQFVVQTTEGCRFVHGGCDDERRIAGRGSETVQLAIPPPTTESVRGADVCTVWGGWAAGHHAVRLTPAVVIRLHANEHNHPGDAHVAEPTWFEVGTEQGCTDGGTLVDAVGMGSRLVVEDTDDRYGKLGVKTEVDAVPAELSLYWSPRPGGDASVNESTIDTLVLETSPGATFTDGACGGKRTVVTKEMLSNTAAWPQLTIHTERTVSVYGVYALTGPDHVDKLYRMDTLTLEWSPPSTDYRARKEAGEKSRNRRNSSRNTHRSPKLPRGTPVDPQRAIDAAARRDASDIQAQVARHNAGHRKEEGVHPGEGKSREGRRRFSRRVTVEALRREPQLSRPYPPRNLRHRPFPVVEGTEYCLAMAFFVAAHVFVIQFCLICSQRPKGRRVL